MSDDYVRVPGTVKQVRAGAVLFAVGDGVPRAAWVPRSLIHGADDQALDQLTMVDAKMALRIREWKADELGWTGPNVQSGGERDLFEANPDMR